MVLFDHNDAIHMDIPKHPLRLFVATHCVAKDTCGEKQSIRNAII